MFEGSYTACDFDHAEAIRMFFDRMKGQRGEFYMPTWKHDLVPLTALTSAGTTVTVENNLEEAYDDNTGWKALAILKTDGSWIFRTVTDVLDAGDNATLTVSAAWGADVAVAEIEMISWMPVWRFATDILTMSWPRDSVANITMAFQIIENLAVE